MKTRTEWHFSVHPVGIVCLLAACLFVPVDRLVAALAAIMLHESAHLIAVGLCHVKYCSVEWTPVGFVAQTDGLAALSAGKRMAIAGAGILISGCLSFFSYLWLSVHPMVYHFFMANLALLLINALPILPLDGGRVLLALSALWGHEMIARRILVYLSYLMATGLCAMSIYGAFCGALNPTLLVLGPYLAYAARKSSIDSNMEWVRSLEDRKQLKPGIFKAESWVAVGEPEALAMIQVLKRTHDEKFVMLHLVDPIDGSLIGSRTQEQILVKLLGETTNNH